MAERTTWTDERIDDAVDSLKRTMILLHEEMVGMRRDMRELRAEMRRDMRDLRAEMRGDMRDLRIEAREDMAALRTDFHALHRHVSRIGWALAITLAAALIALVGASV